jgi:PAS domain S-box-containing protein
MKIKLRVLIVEDSEDDARLMFRELERGGFDPQSERVTTAGALRDALARQPWDVVLADYTLPDFNALQALRILQQSGLDIPFIVVSGSIGEDIAVAMMKRGAHDYLLKQNLARLVPAVERALADTETRRAARRVEDELRASEARFRVFVDHASDAFFLHDERGVILDVNQIACENLGYSREELIGMLPRQFDPDVNQAFSERILARLAAGGVVTFESHHRRKDGTVFPVEIRSRQFWQNGKLYSVSLARDITERKRSEEKLQELSSAVEQSPVSVIITNPEGRIEYVNPKFCEVTGYTVAEALGQNPRILKSGKMPPETYRQLWDALAAGKEWRGEFLNCKKNGEMYWESASISPIVNEAGVTTHYLAVKEDITERKQAEKALHEAKEQLQYILDNTHDVIFQIDLMGNYIYSNAAAEQLTGYPLSQLLQMNMLQLVAPEYHATVSERLQMRRAGTELERSFEFEILHQDGRRIWVELVTDKVCDEDGRLVAVQGVARDITERKQADLRIREQAMLLDKAQDAIFVLDLDERITFWNHSAQRIFGWTAEEAIGRTPADLRFTGTISPQLKAALKETWEHGEWMGELMEFSNAGKNVVVQARTTLIFDDQRRPKSILIIETDITEQKKLEEQFLRAQRLESLGTLAGGIAHDLNNVLAPLRMSVLLLKDEVKDDEARSLLDILEKNVNRGADLVKQVLIFGRGLKGQRIPVQPLPLIREIEQIINETFPKSVRFELHAGTGIWPVTGDATQLHQVLLNLCVNARDAMPQGGKLSIALENISMDDNRVRLHPEAKPGAHVVISVSDTGTGIPTDIQEKMFDPFFTTKGPDKGTGLGLSTSLGIVRSHGGFIACYSEVGQGTTFRVYLPASIPSAQTRAAAEGESGTPGKSKPMHGHNELVLVVDDEAPIRGVAQRMLRHFGYQTLLAANGTEAVELYRARQNEIAAVLTDMAMPVMDGPATILALKAINPHVKIVASSGLANQDDHQHAAELGIHYFLSKPYSAESLMQVLHNMLQPEA